MKPDRSPLMRSIFLATMGPILITSVGCRGLQRSSELDLADSEQEWVLLGNDEILGEGHRFRISPTDEPSKCLMPGGSGLTIQPCGSTGTWHIKKNIDKDPSGHVKVIQSLQDYSCIRFESRGRVGLVSTKCDESNVDQWLALHNSRLKKASFDGKPNPDPAGIPAVNFYVARRTPDQSQDVWRDYIIDGNLQAPQDDKSRSSERSNIYWGRVPAIKSIGVGYRDGVAITGVQLEYRNGSQDILGGCKINAGGCTLDNKDHSAYANPYALQEKEYISKIQVKYSRPPNFKSDYMTEIQVFTKLDGVEKMVLWKGAGNSNAPWKSLDTIANSNDLEPRLSKIPDRILAGLFVSNTKLGSNEVIIGLGGTFVDRIAYQAHNAEIFAPKGSASQTDPDVVEGGGDVIGITLKNVKFTNSQKGAKSVALTRDFENLFTNQSHKFSTAYYASQMEGPKSIGTLRICGAEKVDGIFVRPREISSSLPAETYGEMSCSKPSILDLEADEYITSVWWKPLEGGRWTVIGGPSIGALSINTNKGDGRVMFEGSGLKGGGQWIKGFSKDGYAVVGFHGVANVQSSGDFLDNLEIKGLVNLGPWYGKISSLK